MSSLCCISSCRGAVLEGFEMLSGAATTSSAMHKNLNWLTHESSATHLRPPQHQTLRSEKGQLRRHQPFSRTCHIRDANAANASVQLSPHDLLGKL